jgi:hypothetical protein
MHTSVLTASFLLWASCVVEVLNLISKLRQMPQSHAADVLMT